MNTPKVEKVLQRFSEVGIIPVVVLNDVKDAEPLGQALMEGGLPAAEVTFRTAAAEDSIRIMAEKFPDMLVGAGTVLTIEQAERAVNAGAKFIVSPGFDPEIVQWCLDRDIPVCPGTQTPSEVIQAYKMGLDHVKFFPAENAGGLPMIKAVGAAMTTMKFMPTGGISASNVVEYLKCDKIFCCGGSWMVKGDMIKAGEFDKIKEKVAEAAAIVKEVRG
ncbi:MAG: bifunctional 4-hydroxy-2-oxoglutarate aldolase/2-dehydro-3-deoxy-phosphogluconate aldolase [Lachnospiraceae bacterium]|nr:bifunctional 4-hydroxy-2-oxoglutarate aldolase/2-dehydro-3-deoxy-phosphogluconate aldolase [Lachnospiraceae bacterium]